jgi:flagellar hook-associated protein 2
MLAARLMNRHAGADFLSDGAFAGEDLCMAVIGSTTSSTMSAQIQALAAQLMAKQRQPLQVLQQRESTLNQRFSVLGSLASKLSALKTAVDDLTDPGSLSPFSAMGVQITDTTILSASATSSATAGTHSITVNTLAKASSFASNVYTNTNTALSGAGTGTFGFTLTIDGNPYTASVTINPGDTDQTVLQNVASAIRSVVGTKATATAITQATGQSRISLTSTGTGTSNNITFTDTDGLLARLGVTNAGAADSTNGGYIYKDLGGHELDASITFNGLTVYRESNTVTDLVSGLTLSLKTSKVGTPVSVTVQADAESITGKVKDFIAKYNDVLSYLSTNTKVDTKGGASGVLAFDGVFGGLAGQIRRAASTIVSDIATGQNSLMALGIKPGADGQLAISDETAFKNLIVTDVSKVSDVFAKATTGVGAALSRALSGYVGAAGSISAAQSQLTSRINGIDAQITRTNNILARRQAQLEQQLARQQEMLQRLTAQQNQMNQIIARMMSGSSSSGVLA